MKYFAILALLFCAAAQAATNLPLTCTAYPDCGSSNRVFDVPSDTTRVSVDGGWVEFAKTQDREVLVCAQNIQPGTGTRGCPESAKIRVPHCEVTGAICIPPDAEEEPANNTATVTWHYEPLATDGSKLTDLAGFRIYSGTTRSDGSAPNPNDLGIIATIADPQARLHKIPGFGWGRYFFAATAYTSAGQESARSEITEESTVEFVRPILVPAAPTQVQITP